MDVKCHIVPTCVLSKLPVVNMFSVYSPACCFGRLLMSAVAVVVAVMVRIVMGPDAETGCRRPRMYSHMRRKEGRDCLSSSESLLEHGQEHGSHLPGRLDENLPDVP